MKTRSLIKILLAASMSAAVPMMSLAEDPAPQPSPEKGGKKREGKKDLGPHTGGQITAIDATHIEVKNPKTGETVSVKLNDQTQYGNPKEPKQLADFHVGDVAMIAFNQADDGSKTATHIMAPRKGEKGPGGKHAKDGAPPAAGDPAPSK